MASHRRWSGVSKRFGRRGRGGRRLASMSSTASSWSCWGPSGCGKTTTLRMVAGLEAVSAGRHPDRGPRGAGPPSGRSRCGHGVPELRPVSPHECATTTWPTGCDGAVCHGRTASTQQVKATARLLQIEPYLAPASPSQLSGGQRQRVALGRAIVRHPQAFLMDEPLSNLDAKLRVDMRLELSRLHAELGVTTMYVTHDQVEAMTMGHRIAVMDGGRIQQIGPAASSSIGSRRTCSSPGSWERPAINQTAGCERGADLTGRSSTSRSASHGVRRARGRPGRDGERRHRRHPTAGRPGRWSRTGTRPLGQLGVGRRIGWSSSSTWAREIVRARAAGRRRADRGGRPGCRPRAWVDGERRCERERDHVLRYTERYADRWR